jgi:hypothetical protein
VFNYPYQAYASVSEFFMNYFTQPQLFISAKAKKLGLQLIQELYIQRSARLAFYLDVNPSFDGHEAVLFGLNII